jgi:phosphatidylserine decarboxylase
LDPFSFLFWRFYYFFRDPKRVAPEGRVIVSPADGYILYINEVAPGVKPSPTKSGVPLSLDEWSEVLPPFNEGGILVGIYMAPWSVHFNRAPISGKISRIIKRPARHENLSMARALMRLIWDLKPYEQDSAYITDNARQLMLFEGDISAAMIQIADRYVDQIDCFVNEGERVRNGEKVGMIRMGSQVDLFIPKKKGISVRCNVGDRVFAGTTVLGSY